MSATRLPGRAIKDLSLTDVDIAAANKDGLPAVPSLRTLGLGSQQATAGDDVRLALNDDWFRHSQLSTGAPRFYLCGQTKSGGGLPTTTVALDTLFLMPFRVTTAFVLRAVGVGNTNAPAGCTFNIGIYDSVGPQDLYPNNVVAQLGVANLNAFPAPFQLTGLSLAFAPNAVYWLAVVFSGVAPTCRTINAAVCEPILGFDSTFAGNAGFGWKTAGFPAAVLPPSPVVVPNNTNGTPFMLYGV